MFLTPDELKTHIYAHVIDEITAGDRSIVLQAIEAAVEEARSYLATRYDTDKIFSAAGDERNALVLENVKIIAIWRVITICNVEVIYDMWRERYDRVVAYLRDVARGTISPSLPPITDTDGNTVLQAKFGSNPKFHHSW